MGKQIGGRQGQGWQIGNRLKYFWQQADVRGRRDWRLYDNRRNYVSRVEDRANILSGEKKEGWSKKGSSKISDLNQIHENSFDLIKRGDKNWNEEEKEQLKNAILKYWFLLEGDLKEAIIKGNMNLAPMAVEKIRFLGRVLEPAELAVAIKGEEEALCNVITFLMNEGWWEKASNLKIKLEESFTRKVYAEENEIINFVMQNKELVHPNVIPLIRKRENEGFHMALNQIHYGSLRVRREIMEAKSQMNQNKTSNESKESAGAKKDEDDKETSEGVKDKSYRDVLLKQGLVGDSNRIKVTPASTGAKADCHPNSSVFVYNLLVSVKYHECWV